MRDLFYVCEVHGSYHLHQGRSRYCACGVYLPHVEGINTRELQHEQDPTWFDTPEEELYLNG